MAIESWTEFDYWEAMLSEGELIDPLELDQRTGEPAPDAAPGRSAPGPCIDCDRWQEVRAMARCQRCYSRRFRK